MAWVKLVIVAVVVAAAGCQPHVQTRPDQDAVEREIRAQSRAVVAAEQRKDVESVMPYWAENAVVHMEGAPALRGHPAIREVYAHFFPTFAAFDATIAEVRVAQSGDLAYETGANHFTFVQDGAQVRANGKYLATWQRGSDGVWRIAALAVTNDQAPPGPAEFTAADEAAVRALFDATLANFRTGNFVAWSSQFTENAVLQPPNAKSVIGRAALLDWGRALPRIEDVTFYDVRVSGDGNMAYGTSTYTLKLEGLPADSGKQLVVFRRSPAGRWEVPVVSFSSDLAPAVP